MGSSTSSYARVWNAPSRWHPRRAQRVALRAGEARRPRVSRTDHRRSSARAPVPLTAPRSRAHSAANSRQPASPLSPASPAASTPKHTAAPSTRTGARSPCSAAASTATIPRRTPNSLAGSPRPAASSPSTNPGSSLHRGGSRPQPDHRRARRRRRDRRGPLTQRRTRSPSTWRWRSAVRSTPSRERSRPSSQRERTTSSDTATPPHSRPRSMYSQRSESDDRPYEHRISSTPTSRVASLGVEDWRFEQLVGSRLARATGARARRRATTSTCTSPATCSQKAAT